MICKIIVLKSKIWLWDSSGRHPIPLNDPLPLPPFSTPRQLALMKSSKLTQPSAIIIFSPSRQRWVTKQRQTPSTTMPPLITLPWLIVRCHGCDLIYMHKWGDDDLIVRPLPDRPIVTDQSESPHVDDLSVTPNRSPIAITNRHPLWTPPALSFSDVLNNKPIRRWSRINKRTQPFTP